MSKEIFLPELLRKREEDNRKEKLLLNYVPVYVLLPLFGIVALDNRNAELKTTETHLKSLKEDAYIDGVMVDVWWGIVESDAPEVYKWNAYKDLFNMIKSLGLKIYAIMSFHKSSEKTKTIPLPKWILRIGEQNPDIYYTDQNLFRNEGCLSLGVDDESIFPDGKGGRRTAIQVYSDYMSDFRREMAEFLDAGVIVAIQVGLGPNGELCYPSFPQEDGRWEFPNIGEFQCYDKYLREDFDAEAKKKGHQSLETLTKEFGHYKSEPEKTEFFKENGTYTKPEGKSFLEWYSTKLILHGDKILREANKIFAGLKIDLVAKVSAVHWQQNHPSHAAELTAGYYNTRDSLPKKEDITDGRNGYRPIARMLSKRNCFLNFSCLEMKNPNAENASHAPHDLVKAVLISAWREGIEVIGGNTWEVESAEGYNQVVLNARPNGFNPDGKPKRKVHSYMHLRLSEKIVNNYMFKQFVQRMHADQDYCGDSEKYAHEVESESAITSEEILAASEQRTRPFEWDFETDMKVYG